MPAAQRGANVLGVDIARNLVAAGNARAQSLGLTNLTGHPAVAVRAGFVADAPLMLMLTGRLYEEATLMGVALAHERATTWNEKNPMLSAE